MKLFVYAGEALNEFLSGSVMNAREIFREHRISGDIETEVFFNTQIDVYFPKYQVEFIDINLEYYKDKKDVTMCTHSPVALEAIIKSGKKHGYEIVAYNVIYDNDNKSIAKAVQAKTLSGTLEMCFKDFNSAYPSLNALGPDLEENK